MTYRDFEWVAKRFPWVGNSVFVSYVRDVDPLLRCGFGLDPMPEDWKTRMREVGIDPDAEGPEPDGKFHVVDGSFAMAANYTGLELTRDILATAKFVLGHDGD